MATPLQFIRGYVCRRRAALGAAVLGAVLLGAAPAPGNETEADAAADHALAQATTITIPAGELSLGQALELLRQGDHSVYLELGLDKQQSSSWEEEQKLSWWQAVQQIGERFAIHPQLIANHAPRESASSNLSIHHQTARRVTGDDGAEVRTTLSVKQGHLALASGQRSTSQQAIIGPYNIEWSDLLLHHARMLSGSNRWLELSLHISAEPRLRQLHHLQATITWQRAHNQAGEARQLGPVAIAESLDPSSDHQRQQLRHHQQHLVVGESLQQEKPPYRSQLLLSDLQSDDEIIYVHGQLDLLHSHDWEHQKTALAAHQWQEIPYGQQTLWLLLLHDTEKGARLAAERGIKDELLFSNPGLILLLPQDEEAVPLPFPQVRLARQRDRQEVQFSSQRSGSGNNRSDEEFRLLWLGLRNLGMPDAAYLLRLDARLPQQQLTIPLHLGVRLP